MATPQKIKLALDEQAIINARRASPIDTDDEPTSIDEGSALIGADDDVLDDSGAFVSIEDLTESGGRRPQQADSSNPAPQATTSDATVTTDPVPEADSNIDVDAAIAGQIDKIADDDPHELEDLLNVGDNDAFLSAEELAALDGAQPKTEPPTEAVEQEEVEETASAGRETEESADEAPCDDDAPTADLDPPQEAEAAPAPPVEQPAAKKAEEPKEKSAGLLARVDLLLRRLFGLINLPVLALGESRRPLLDSIAITVVIWVPLSWLLAWLLM